MTLDKRCKSMMYPRRRRASTARSTARQRFRSLLWPCLHSQDLVSGRRGMQCPHRVLLREVPY